MEQTNPTVKLRKLTGLNKYRFAAQTEISRGTLDNLEAGKLASGETWRAISARWGEELRTLRLVAEDFVGG